MGMLWRENQLLPVGPKIIHQGRDRIINDESFDIAKLIIYTEAFFITAKNLLTDLLYIKRYWPEFKTKPYLKY